MYPEEVKNFISGDYSVKDKSFVGAWLREDQAREKELRQLRDIWQATGSLRLLDDADIEAAWNEVNKKVDSEQNVHRDKVQYMARGRRNSSKWGLVLKVAAVVFLVFGFYAISRYVSSPSGNTQVVKVESPSHIIRSKNGERVQVQLQDGTVVMLNSGSRLIYNDAYGSKNRTVHLSGEAYFKVNNDNQSFSFIVKAGHALVRDLSTEFNVKAYADEDNTSVVVADGSVEVLGFKDSAQTTAPVRVNEGHKVSVSDADDSLTIRPADLDYTLGWLQNKLIFKEATFRTIARRLERYYNITVVSESEALNNKKVTATFKNERMKKVLHVIALSLGAEYKIRGDRVVFTLARQQ